MMYANRNRAKNSLPLTRESFLYVSRAQYERSLEKNLIAGLQAIATTRSDDKKSRRRRARRAKAARK